MYNRTQRWCRCLRFVQVFARKKWRHAAQIYNRILVYLCQSVFICGKVFWASFLTSDRHRYVKRLDTYKLSFSKGQNRMILSLPRRQMQKNNTPQIAHRSTASPLEYGAPSPPSRLTRTTTAHKLEPLPRGKHNKPYRLGRKGQSLARHRLTRPTPSDSQTIDTISKVDNRGTSERIESEYAEIIGTGKTGDHPLYRIGP